MGVGSSFSPLRIIKSFSFAIKGIIKVFSKEANMHIHLLAVAVVSLTAWFLNLSSIEWAIIILTFALVISFEMINTAVEKLVDLVHPEQHPIAGTVKDIAAGAVLISSILSVIIAGFIFLPKILNLFSSL